MFICIHCQKEFINLSTSQKANHTRWCTENPKRSTYGNDGKQFQTEEAIKKRIEGIKRAHTNGKYTGSAKKASETRKRNGTHLHTDESKELIKQKALASKHRRLTRHVREYTMRDGSVIKLDSSWEEALAKRLDELKIEWIRPEEPIHYFTLNGEKHNYFPDFYLPKYDLYLDPKNPAAINAQKDKISILLNKMNNLIIIKTLDECINYEVN